MGLDSFENMKPSHDKAFELIQKFLRLEDETFFYWCPTDRRLTDNEVLDHAKKCAALVCIECIKEHKNNARQDIWVEYWQEVLKEVQKFKFS